MAQDPHSVHQLRNIEPAQACSDVFFERQPEDVP